MNDKDKSPVSRRGFMTAIGSMVGVGAAATGVNAQSEWTQPAHTIPGRIEAEDFTDYYDFNEGNNGGFYRDTDVDIEAGKDEDGTPTVGWIWFTEVLTYEVDVTPGTYNMVFRAASWRDEGGVLVFLGSRLLTHLTFETSTEGIYDYRDHVVENIQIDEDGSETLYVQFLGGSTNFNWIEFKDTSEPLNSYGEMGYGEGGYGGVQI